MSRRRRRDIGGEVYHALNRAAGKYRMLRTDKDFAAMERLLAEALERVPIRLLSYCLMGSHWHLVLWPREGGELSTPRPAFGPEPAAAMPGAVSPCWTNRTVNLAVHPHRPKGTTAADSR
ncbi:MAG TPA: hypothetical protein VHY37_05135 [Tepidisphaeraceae bacterium]|jgi:hypothetical protein|nr:hypothetical protein [Tepidisphaeraceae bacterium]